MSTSPTISVVDDRVREALTEFGADPALITREATWEQIDIDSLDLVELSQIAEEEFGVVLKTDDLREITTVGEAIDLIVQRIE